jgi:hypothetical protein
LFKKATMLTPSTRESLGLVCANGQKTVCWGVDDMFLPGAQLTPSLAVLRWGRYNLFWLSASIGLLWNPEVRGDKRSWRWCWYCVAYQRPSWEKLGLELWHLWHSSGLCVKISELISD